MILINSILISALFRLLMEQAIHEALLTAPGRAVDFSSGITQLEILPQFAPQVEGCQRKADLGDIALDPLDLSDTSSETLPGALQSHGGDVQHRRPDKAQR